MMKINYGKFKGKKIIVGNNKNMRPTQSMAKSIIFNTIKIDDNTKVLDLFAGTGLLGFESASLGASKVYWIDNNVFSAKAIKQNIENLNLEKNNFKIFKTDFRTALKKIEFKPNLIFLDPPFIATKYYDEALNFIFDKNVLAIDGVIILEKEFNIEIKSLKKYSVFKEKRLGSKDIIFLRK